jgi:hypothetical protein
MGWVVGLVVCFACVFVGEINFPPTKQTVSNMATVPTPLNDVKSAGSTYSMSQNPKLVKLRMFAPWECSIHFRKL